MADATNGAEVATYEVEVRGPLPPALLRAVPHLEICPHHAGTIIHRELRGPTGWAEVDVLLEELQSFGLRLTEVRVSRRVPAAWDRGPSRAGQSDAR